jgi:hypothetical protein
MPTQSNQANKVEFEFDQRDIWAAAVHAYNINQGYYKQAVYENINDVSVKIKEPNRTISDNVLANLASLTQDDYDQGQKAKTYLNAKFCFAALSGKLNDFERTVYNACNMEKFTHKNKLEYAVVISSIASYFRYLHEDEVNQKYNSAAPDLGAIGDKVEVEIEVIKNIFSIKYGVNFITGITDLGQRVFFSFRIPAKMGDRINVKGTIKAFRPDATQLNRAKIIDHK